MKAFHLISAANLSEHRCQLCAAPFSTVQCARFIRQTPAIRELGCNRCHQVERSCAACHGAHATDLAIVRAPQVCAKCHMGPDHPQWEMWQTSRHGALAATGTGLGATCQDCHMPAGHHDVSRGITASPGQAPLADAAARREEMLAVCAGCHARSFARRDLERADRVRSESLALVRQGETLLQELAEEDLLDPSLAERPPHPLRGSRLVTDGQMLYEDISHAERLFFKMQKYDLAKTVKGAYHQNPTYTHWYGNAELKMDLVDLRAEASRLRQWPTTGTDTAGSNSESGIEAALQRLKARFAGGELTTEAYRAQKRRLLDRFRAPPVARER